MWRDYRHGSVNGQIYGYDLTAKKEIAICTTAGYHDAPAICDNIVAWQDNRNSDLTYYDIYGYDLTAKKEFPICTDVAGQFAPAVSSDLVVWQDAALYNANYIYGYVLASKTEFPICTQALCYEPAISGDTVVWEDARAGNWDIYAATVTITSDKTPPVTVAHNVPAGWKNKPVKIDLHGQRQLGRLRVGLHAVQGRRGLLDQGHQRHREHAGHHHGELPLRRQGRQRRDGQELHGDVDTGVPSTSATAATVKATKVVTLKFAVSDPLPSCGSAKVTIQIMKGSKVLKSLAVGKKATNKSLSYKWKAALKKGSYTYRVLATDVAGNKATTLGSATLKVK